MMMDKYTVTLLKNGNAGKGPDRIGKSVLNLFLMGQSG